MASPAHGIEQDQKAADLLGLLDGSKKRQYMLILRCLYIVSQCLVSLDLPHNCQAMDAACA